MEIAPTRRDTLSSKHCSYKSCKKIEKNNMEYGLTQHMFDPSKSSPPKNEFLIKLFRRINHYESCEINNVNFIKK